MSLCFSSVTDFDQWFSLDDRKTSPAAESDIERYFGGKECAYILYYRQKCLNRPPEASASPCHGVPQHLIDKINETNETLRSQRCLVLCPYQTTCYC